MLRSATNDILENELALPEMNKDLQKALSLIQNSLWFKFKKKLLWGVDQDLSKKFNDLSPKKIGLLKPTTAWQKKGRRKALLHTWQSLFFPLCTRLRFSDAKQLKRLFPFPRLRSFSKRMMLSPVKVLSSKSAEARSVFWPFCHLDGKSLAFDKRRPICLSHSWPSWCPSNAHSRRTQGRCV